MQKPTDAQIEATVKTEEARVHADAQRPATFTDNRPAPTSDGARTMRDAAKRNASPA